MSQHLTDMDIDRVSLVDKGANGRVFAILKRQEAPMTNPVAKSDPQASTDILGLVRKVAEKLGILKASTFGSIIAGQELYDALDESYDTLWSALYSAMWAYDANGQDLPIAEKQALVAQSLDEFKAYLLNAMDTGVGKRARPTEAAIAKRRIVAAIAKVGAKVSAARLERLQSAAEALNSVLAEVEADTEKRADAQEADMTADELTAAIAKAQEPILARLEAIEKGTSPAAPATDPAAGEKKDGAEDDLTLEGVAKGLLQLREDLDPILKARGERTSADGQESETVKKSASKWAGVL